MRDQGIGVGFGLQNIVNNFVSGLILLFERPVRVGDAVQIGDVQGEVRRIGIRATTVRAWEGAEVIVPNSQLVAERVTNWTPADYRRRLDIPVNVAYGSAPDKVIQVLTEVATVTNGHPVANAYYPVYSDQRRGSAGYCAWHSSGTIAGIRVQFGFFFSLDGDPGCDPASPPSLGHSQGLAALANVSGHELSEMLTDPQLNAWYDQKGAENSDKCAWTFDGTVSIGGQSWKIQGNWSNAAASSNSGYANVGCIQTS